MQIKPCTLLNFDVVNWLKLFIKSAPLNQNIFDFEPKALEVQQFLNLIILSNIFIFVYIENKNQQKFVDLNKNHRYSKFNENQILKNNVSLGSNES